ncbi:ABC transporter permease, partial [Lactobacillus nasalidis]
QQKRLASQASQLAKQEKQLKKAKQTLAQTGKVSYTVSDRSANPGYAIFQSNSERVDILANVFPVLLFAIAALVSLTTMTRFVEEERISIGTFKALGYSNRDLSLKFVLFSASASLLGVGIGAAGGYTFLPKLIFEAYAANSTISNCQLLFNWKILALTIVIALACTTGAALFVLKRDLADKPASLLLPKPPKNGSRILLERFKPLWSRMSFNYKVTMRNLFRYKSRAFMTIFGVAGCCGLLVMGFGIQDSLSGISQVEYSRIITYDLIAVKKNALTSKQQSKLDDSLSSSAVKKHTAVRYEQLTKKAGQDKSDQSISLIVPSSSQALSGYISLNSRASGKKLTLKDDGAVISEKLAKLLGAKVGSYIKLKDSDGSWHKIKVTGICEMYIGHYVFMNKAAYKKFFDKKASANAQLITLKPGQSLAKYSRKLMKSGAIQGINQNTSNKQTIDNIMGSLNRVMIILIGMATLLALVVIYNLSNINVEERIRELSTIKVLGFFDNETTLYIYRETIILSVIGILCGYLLGIGLHSFIITSLPPDNAMFDPAMKASNFMYSALIPAVITALVALVMHKKIKSVNMLDALKSVD